MQNKNRVKLEYYIIDEENDCELIREEIFISTEFSAYIRMPLHSTYLLKIINI